MKILGTVRLNVMDAINLPNVKKAMKEMQHARPASCNFLKYMTVLGTGKPYGKTGDIFHSKIDQRVSCLLKILQIHQAFCLKFKQLMEFGASKAWLQFISCLVTRLFIAPY